MYEGPSALVNREDYLLGRKVDKSFQLLEAAEKGGNSAWLSEAEKGLHLIYLICLPGISNIFVYRFDSLIHLETIWTWRSGRCGQKNQK